MKPTTVSNETSFHFRSNYRNPPDSIGPCDRYKGMAERTGTPETDGCRCEDEVYFEAKFSRSRTFLKFLQMVEIARLYWVGTHPGSVSITESPLRYAFTVSALLPH